MLCVCECVRISICGQEKECKGMVTHNVCDAKGELNNGQY